MGVKTTFDAGYLVPIYADEALPGDTFNVRMHFFARLATPIYPLMDNMHCETFFFAVPNRLLWNNWERFNGAQDNPGDSTSFLVPTCTAPVGGYGELSLHDYFGIPTKVAGLVHNNLHLRAYNFVWNEFFRDQSLQNSVVVDKDDGPDTPTDYVLLRRGKRHDYFTSCLPFAQKGTSVPIPIGSTAPVYGNGKALGLTQGTTNYGLAINATPQMQGFVGNYNSNVGSAAAGASIAGNQAVGVVPSPLASGLVAALS